MGYHDRDDANYSAALHTPTGRHAYERLHALNNPTYLPNVLGHSAPAQPHWRVRRLNLPTPLPIGARVRCVKKPGGTVVESLDGTYVGPVAPHDARDLDAQLTKGPLPGITGDGHIDVELED